MPRALITGISGQDGSYLADLLLEKGYEVHGLVREGRLGAAGHLRGLVTEHEGDVRDADAVGRAVAASEPDEIYHMAATTRPGKSFDDPEGVHDIVAGGTIRVLEAAPDAARIFCAGSSEIFAGRTSAPQDETTQTCPRNPYGEAKVAALEATRARRQQGAFACTGILFTHESVRRPGDFVTRKVTRGAAAIATGKAERLTLGALDARRDWGHAPDYMDAAWRMLQATDPDDYVIATGVTHSVRELVELAFAEAGVDPDGRVVVDPALVREEPEVLLVGDSTKARERLGWLPSTTFEAMIAAMVRADLEELT